MHLVVVPVGAAAWPDQAAYRRVRQDILRSVSPEDPPVLFNIRYPGMWRAYTSNVVNCVIVEGKALIPDTHGPTVAGVNYFHQRVIATMSGTVQRVFVDSWDLHLIGGELHCGSNVRREPISDVKWWEAWPEE